MQAQQFGDHKILEEDSCCGRGGYIAARCLVSDTMVLLHDHWRWIAVTITVHNIFQMMAGSLKPLREAT